jgi:hypothetical protein
MLSIAKRPLMPSAIMLNAIRQSVVMLGDDGNNLGAYGMVRFKKCKHLFEYQYLLLLRDIWWSKFYSIFKCCSLIQHQC